MSEYKPFTSASGIFWSHKDQSIRMAGHLTVDGFPRLELFNAGVKEAIPLIPRQTIFGVTDQGESVSLYGTLGYNFPWGTNVDDDPNKPDEVRHGNKVQLTANYLLIGPRLFEDDKVIRQISFASSVAENFFQLDDDDLLRRLKFVKSAWSQDHKVPLHSRQVRSFVSHRHRIRLRVFASTLPNESIIAKAVFKIDFFDLVKLDYAVRKMQDLRDLITILCNEFADIQAVTVKHKSGDRSFISKLVFYNFRESFEGKSRWNYAMLNLTSSDVLFRKMISNWLDEDEVYTIARRIFASGLREDTVLKYGDIRELVTVLEMVSGDRFRPMKDTKFQKLRRTLQAVVDVEITNAAERGEDVSGLSTIKGSLLYINGQNSKKAVTGLVETIPVSLREGIINDSVALVDQIISLRDKITHDPSKLADRDYKFANEAVHKLRWICGVLDILKLGASPIDVGSFYKFHRRAFGVSETIWSKEDASDSE